MRSIPLAMTWEFLQRGKLLLPAAALSATVLPGLVFGALQFDGALDLEEPSLINIFFVFTLLGGLILGAAVMHAQGRPARLYAFPVPTPTLVIWHLVPGMAALVLMSLASSTALNVLLDLGLPLWGPALFLAVALAATQAVLWLTEKSVWCLFAFATVWAILGIWYQSRYGAAFSQPTRLWLEVTSTDVLTILAAAGIAIYGATVAISRDRCGEALTSPRLRAWFERIFDPAPRAGLPFRNGAQAQFWYEWRQKGPALPAAVVLCLIVGFGCWLIFSRVPRNLVDGLVGLGAMLSAIGVVAGIITGNTGPDDANYAVGQHLATRPITDTELARTILKTAGLGVTLAWVIWAVAFLAVYGMILATNAVPPPVLPKGVHWWYLPVTLVGLWTTVTIVTSLGLMGRPKLVLIFLIAGFSLFIGIDLYSKYALSREERTMLFHGSQFVVGVACVLGTLWIFIAARRRSLIGAPTAGIASALWCTFCALVIVEWALHPERQLPDYLLVAGLLALTVAPLAAAPLALAWNRHR